LLTVVFFFRRDALKEQFGKDFADSCMGSWCSKKERAVSKLRSPLAASLPTQLLQMPPAICEPAKLFRF
jgi:hypothetical protein